ncbi:MAG: ribosomal protein S18-alanine N-acetyltransferase [Clostridia bacterium]|nr:ribosomal protein S18-alanine N-acetyltransferase [Clostridia bacterium]
MNITVTEMKKKHVEAIALLEKECFSSPWSENALAEELDNPDSHFLVAECDSVAGYIGVQEILGEAYITNIAVFENFRKKGIGRILLNAAVKGAASRNCEFITLEVRVSNTAAISLYESEGFEKIGVRKNFYASPVEDGAIYTKYFSGGKTE